MEAAWARLQRWLAQHAPPAKGPLGPGVGDALAFAPGDPAASGPLAPLLRLADGQPGGRGLGLFDCQSLLSAAEARQHKQMMDDLARSEGWDLNWWDPAWFPFAEDGAGQLLVVHQHSGAVIEFNHDDDARPVLAPSLTAYVDGIADRLERGALRYDPRFGFVDAEQQERFAREQQARPTKERINKSALRALAAVAVAVGVPLALLIWWLETSRP